jgi:hypothetical protein
VHTSQALDSMTVSSIANHKSSTGDSKMRKTKSTKSESEERESFASRRVKNSRQQTRQRST